jgi:thioredoxin-like negative regulator of GroEL
MTPILREELKDHEYACGYVEEALSTINDLMAEKATLTARVAELERQNAILRDWARDPVEVQKAIASAKQQAADDGKQGKPCQ